MASRPFVESLLYREGTRLMVAASDGYEKMVVRTEVWNERAIRFYELNGFMSVGQETMDVNNAKVRVLVLERVLNQTGR